MRHHLGGARAPSLSGVTDGFCHGILEHKIALPVRQRASDHTLSDIRVGPSAELPLDLLFA